MHVRAGCAGNLVARGVQPLRGARRHHDSRALCGEKLRDGQSDACAGT